MKLPNGAVRARIEFGRGIHMESPSPPDDKPDVWSVYEYKAEDKTRRLVSSGLPFKSAHSLARSLANFARVLVRPRPEAR